MWHDAIQRIATHQFLVLVAIRQKKKREQSKKLTLYVTLVGLTWVAPLLNGCVAGAVGWFGAEGGAEEPGVTVDGELVLVLPLLPLTSSAASEPGVCGV